jgi:4-carboxymuconolactone decarboxylase
MTRIPLITDRAELDASAHVVFDAIQGSRGLVRGPFAVLLHRPEIASGAQQIGGFLRYSSELPRQLREGLILVVARLTGCDFEWSAHQPLAAAAGLSEETLADIEAGRLDYLDGDLGLAAGLARSLITSYAVDSELFEQARQRWSDADLVEVVTLIGYYSYIAMVVNAFEVAPNADMGPGISRDKRARRSTGAA